MRRGLKLLFFYWLPPFLWMAIIFKLSSGPVPVTSQVYWQDFVVKKFAHFCVFGFLAVLYFRVFRGYGFSKKKSAVWALVLATLYGASDEYHQSFSQAREARIRDIGFDGLGALSAVYFVYQILPKLPKKLTMWCEKIDLI